MTMTDGNKIRDARVAAGISSQEKAARLFDVSGKTFYNWENSETIKPHTLKGILQTLEEYKDAK